MSPASGIEALDEVRRLAQRVRFRRGHHQERRAGRLQQPVGPFGTLAEATEHGVKRADERLRVLEHLRAQDLGQRAGHHGEPGVQHLHVRHPGPGRDGQQPDQPAIEEPAEPLRRVEEVQRRPAGRGIHHDEVPLVGVPELAELLHRHVLLRPGEARGQRLVERVGQDLRGPVRVGVRLDDFIERPLHVQHHRVQAAAAGGVDAVHRPRGVVQGGQAHRLGQPPGWVDGQHAGLPAAFGGAQADRGRGRGLADAARSAADDDPGPPVIDDPVHVQLHRAHAAPCSLSFAASW
jgi:hypothetical protein